MLVIDASVAIAACHTPVGFARFRGHEMVAPQLMIVEASSVFHEMSWREAISMQRAKQMVTRLLKADIEIRTPKGLTSEAQVTSRHRKGQAADRLAAICGRFASPAQPDATHMNADS